MRLIQIYLCLLISSAAFPSYPSFPPAFPLSLPPSFHVCMYVCKHACMCGASHIHVGVCASRGQTDVACLHQLLSAMFLLRRPLFDPGVHQLARLADQQTLGLHQSPPPTHGFPARQGHTWLLQGCSCVPGFSSVCTGPSPTALSPAPQLNICYSSNVFYERQHRHLAGKENL